MIVLKTSVHCITSVHQAQNKQLFQSVLLVRMHHTQVQCQWKTVYFAHLDLIAMLEQVRLTAQKATTALKVLQIKINTLVQPVLTTLW